MAGSKPTSASDSLLLELTVPPAVMAGAEVPITLRLTNITEDPLRLHLMGRVIAFDLIVRREDRSTVWRRLQGQIVPAILRIEILQPGETLLLDDRWNQRTNEGDSVEPGQYSVEALVPTNAGPLRPSPVTLRIDPG